MSAAQKQKRKAVSKEERAKEAEKKAREEQLKEQAKEMAVEVVVPRFLLERLLFPHLHKEWLKTEVAQVGLSFELAQRCRNAPTFEDRYLERKVAEETEEKIQEPKLVTTD